MYVFAILRSPTWARDGRNLANVTRIVMKVRDVRLRTGRQLTALLQFWDTRTTPGDTNAPRPRKVPLGDLFPSILGNLARG